MSLPLPAPFGEQISSAKDTAKQRQGTRNWCRLVTTPAAIARLTYYALAATLKDSVGVESFTAAVSTNSGQIVAVPRMSALCRYCCKKIFRIPTREPPPLEASSRRNHGSSIIARPFSTASTRCGHSSDGYADRALSNGTPQMGGDRITN